MPDTPDGGAERRHDYHDVASGLTAVSVALAELKGRFISLERTVGTEFKIAREDRGRVLGMVEGIHANGCSKASTHAALEPRIRTLEVGAGKIAGAVAVGVIVAALISSIISGVIVYYATNRSADRAGRADPAAERIAGRLGEPDLFLAGPKRTGKP